MLIDLRLKQPRRSTAYALVPTFPVALFLMPLAWFTRKVKQTATWELVTVSQAGETVEEFASLSRAREARSRAVSQGGKPVFDRARWSLLMAATPVCGLAMVTPAVRPTLSVAMAVAIAAGVASAIGVSAAWLIITIGRRRSVDSDERRLILMSWVLAIVAIVLPLLGGELLSGGLPLLVVAAIVHRGMPALARHRCRQAGLPSERLIALTW